MKDEFCSYPSAITAAFATTTDSEDLGSPDSILVLGWLCISSKNDMFSTYLVLSAIAQMMRSARWKLLP